MKGLQCGSTLALRTRDPPIIQVENPTGGMPKGTSSSWDSCGQCFGSVSGFSIGSLDQDQDLESGSGSRQAKKIKSKELSCFEVLLSWLQGGLRIKTQANF